MYCNFKELHKAITCEKAEENEKARALWSFQEATDKGPDVYDLGSVQKINTRSHVRLGLWAIHPEELTGCLGIRAVAHGRWSRTGSQASAGGSETCTSSSTERALEFRGFSSEDQRRLSSVSPQ